MIAVRQGGRVAGRPPMLSIRLAGRWSRALLATAGILVAAPCAAQAPGHVRGHGYQSERSKKAPAPPVRRRLPKIPDSARGFDLRHPPPDARERTIAIGGGWGGRESPKPKLASRTARGYYALGHEYLRQIEFEKAIPPLERAVRLRPAYLAAYRDLAAAYAYAGTERADSPQAQRRRFLQAIRAFERVERMRPRETETRFNLALLYFDTSQFARSIDAFRAGIRLAGRRREYPVPLLESGQTCDIFRYLGDAYRFLGRRDQAIACYLRDLAAPGDHIVGNVRINLGRLYEDTGQPERALACYDKYLESNDPPGSHNRSEPEEAGVLLRVGLIHASAGRLESGAEALVKSAGVAQEWIDQWEVIAKSESDSESKRWLTGRIAALKETAARASYNLGVVRLAMRQPDEALAAFAAALQSQPKYSAARYNLAVALHELGRDAEADEQLQPLQVSDSSLARELERLLKGPLAPR